LGYWYDIQNAVFDRRPLNTCEQGEPIQQEPRFVGPQSGDLELMVESVSAATEMKQFEATSRGLHGLQRLDHDRELIACNDGHDVNEDTARKDLFDFVVRQSVWHGVRHDNALRIIC
jgi:hypothetical protein